MEREDGKESFDIDRSIGSGQDGTKDEEVAQEEKEEENTKEASKEKGKVETFG